MATEAMCKHSLPYSAIIVLAILPKAKDQMVCLSLVQCMSTYLLLKC